MTHPNDQASRVLKDQLQLLFKQSPQTFASSSIISALTVYIFWDQISHLQLLSWLLLICIVNVMRLGLIRTYARGTVNLSTETWLYRLMLITGTAGVIWGAGALLFMQQSDIPHQMFIAMILAGITAGALAAYSSSAVTYRLFLLPCLVVPGIWLLLQHEPMQVAAGTMLMLYVALMLVLNTRQYQMLTESLNLRYHNTDLLEHLESEVCERRKNEERLRLSEEQLQEKTAQMQSLLRLAGELEQAESYDRIMSAATREITQVFGYTHAWIYLMGDNPDVWHLLGSGEISGDLALKQRLPQMNIRGDAMLEAIAAASGPVVVDDALTDARTNKQIVRMLGNRTIINIPIMLSEKRLGTLGTGTFGDEGVRPPSGSELQHLCAIASHLALALDRVRLVNDRLDMQSQLEHSQRLDSLGLMAGGIAHDFNNILTSIMGNAAIADRHMQQEPDAAKLHLKRIVESSKRAADLCNQMLAYSGKGHFAVEMVNLNQMLTEVIPLLETAIGKHAEISYDLFEPLPVIEVDIAQMQQVIMNLIINASEAISTPSGQIRVTTGIMDADAAALSCCYGSSPKPGHFVYMEISDTGCGMDRETAECIFDPFFTTKFTGRGLGMSAILGIVRGHAGAIFLDSTPGEGTTFRVIIPSHDVCLIKTNPVEQGQAHVAVQGQYLGTVLVVDDEEAVRELTVAILQDDGFEVLEAEHGEQGVEIYRQHKQDISLVLLDLTMPRMSGIDCFRALQSINPDVKVILISGYSEDDVLGQFDGYKLCGFISKPFMPEELMTRVGEVLSQQKLF